jgi:MFS family permease
MVPELGNAFGISPLAVASIVGLFYYGYAPFSLVAGAAMDRLGPRRLLPGAAAVVGIGALLFATGNRELASVGRFLPGAGGVFDEPAEPVGKATPSATEGDGLVWSASGAVEDLVWRAPAIRRPRPLLVDPALR